MAAPKNNTNAQAGIEPLCEVLTVRVTPSEKVAIWKLSKSRGFKSISEFARNVLTGRNGDPSGELP